MAAPVKVQHDSIAGGNGVATLAATLTGVTAGNSIVALCFNQYGEDITSVDDGTAYGPNGSVYVDGTNAQWSWHYLSNVAGGDHTVTVTYASTAYFPKLVLIEVSGAIVADGATGNYSASFGTGTDAVTTGDLTTNVPDTLLICALHDYTYLATRTAGTGFTQDTPTTWGGGGYRDLEYGAKATAGAVAGTWTQADANTVAVVMAAFASASSPPTIDTDPNTRAANDGGIAEFYCHATSNGGTGGTYQWQVNDGGGWTDVGTNSTLYTRTGVASGDNGLQVRCTYTDSVDSVTSATATLTVLTTWPELAAYSELAFSEFTPEAGGGGGSGSLSVTQSANTVSTTGTLALQGNSATAQGGNSLSATAQLAIQGSSAITQGGTTVAAAGVGAAPITGSAAITQGGSTCAATATLELQGSAAVSQAGNTVASTATLAVQGGESAAQAGNAVSAAAVLAVQGSASVAQAANLVSAAGQLPIAGATSIAQGGNSVTAAAQLAVVGSASVGQTANTVVATGSGASGNTGSADIVQVGNAVSAVGALAIQGSASVGQAGNMLAAIGAVPIIGTLAVQLDDTTVSGVGHIYITATSSANLAQGGNIVTAIGQVALAGGMTVQQGGHSLSAIGQTPIIGTLAVQLADSILVASARLDLVESAPRYVVAADLVTHAAANVRTQSAVANFTQSISVEL